MPHAARAMKIDQWTPGIRPTWSVAQVKSALYSHQTGNFTESALLVEAMYADDELPSALGAAVDEIVGSAFSLDPVQDGDGEPFPASQALADQLAPLWEESFPEHEVANLIRWFIMLGVAVAVIDWDKRPGKWTPKLRVLHPQFLYWDEGTLDPQTGLMGVWRYSARDREHIVTPGDGHWVLLSDGRESWMRSSVRALATTWLVKQYTWRDWARYNERHGLPILVGKVPTFADDKADFLNDLKRLGSETTIIAPQLADEDGPSYGVDLLEAKDGAWESFERTIQRCDRKFQVHFSGTNTNELIGTAGSRATSESGRSIATQTAAQRERRITTDLRDQLVRPWVAYTVPGAAMDMVPWPHWAVEGEEDVLRRAESLKAFADAMVALKAAGYELSDVAAEAKRFDIQLRETEEEEENDDADDDSRGSGDGGNADRDSDDGDAAEGLAALADDRRDGAIAAQEYLDGLTASLADQAAALEDVAAEDMARIVSEAKDAEDLRARLLEHVGDASPVALAGLFEKAILLSSLAGRLAVIEDL